MTNPSALVTGTVVIGPAAVVTVAGYLALAAADSRA